MVVTNCFIEKTKQHKRRYHRDKQNNVPLIVYLLAVTITREYKFGNSRDQWNFIRDTI